MADPLHLDPVVESLCCDSKSETRNYKKSGVTDGSFQRPETPLRTSIATLSHPRPLPRRPLSLSRGRLPESDPSVNKRRFPLACCSSTRRQDIRACSMPYRASFRDDDLIPTLCKISAIGDSPF